MLTVLSITAYTAALVVAVGALFALVTGRLDSSPTTAWILCIACLFAGPPLASAVSPDWSPLSLLLGVAPFLIVAVWAGTMGARMGRKSRT